MHAGVHARRREIDIESSSLVFRNVSERVVIVCVCDVRAPRQAVCACVCRGAGIRLESTWVLTACLSFSLSLSLSLSLSCSLSCFLSWSLSFSVSVSAQLDHILY